MEEKQCHESWLTSVAQQALPYHAVPQPTLQTCPVGLPKHF
jgi:hypothetical protein